MKEDIRFKMRVFDPAMRVSPPGPLFYLFGSTRVCARTGDWAYGAVVICNKISSSPALPSVE
jgi:hypothetical protein